MDTRTNSDQQNASRSRLLEEKPTYEHGLSTILQPGAQAPDFCLPSTPDQQVCLHEFNGRPVVLVFYPADWSPVCGDQLSLYNEILPEFKKYQAEILAISTDSPWSHMAYAKDRKLRIPLLSDFEPKGAVARNYGVYDEKKGVCDRALFVLNSDHVIHWSYLSPIGVNPGADGILDALESLPQKSNQRKETLQ
jgi:peroxiredoxin